MAIWKLDPTDLASPDWEASTYRGAVIVRADSERRARDIADSAFGIATDIKAGEKIKIVPWSMSSLVSASILTDSAFDEDGEEGVLGPPEAVAHITKLAK